MVEKLPTHILPTLSWSFCAPPFADSAQFASEVGAWLMEIGDTWEPEAVVLPVPRVLVTYRNASDSGEGTVELVSDNGRCFTARELLFQIHNAIADEIGDLDHHFFEGLELHSLPLAGSPPIYELRLGS